MADVLQERGIEFAYSIEPDGAFVYGSEDTIQQIQDILWAAEVVDGLGMMFGAEPFEQVSSSHRHEN